MTDNPLEPDVPDLHDPHLECLAHRKQPGVIGARQHQHLCRQFPEHALPHVCYACGATFTSQKTAA